MQVFLSWFAGFTPAVVILRLCAAAIIGGLIGIERSHHGRAAGLRTHILVCIGAAMTSLCGLYLRDTLGYEIDIARLSAQVISGIGFLGAGTILIRNNSMITGLTTAAGMWATAAIGIAVGYGFYSAAVGATVIGIFSVGVLSRLEKKHKNTMNVYLELSDISCVQSTVDRILKLDRAVMSYHVMPPKSGHEGHVGILFVLYGTKHCDALKTVAYEEGGVAFILNDIDS